MPEQYKKIEGWLDFDDLYDRIFQSASNGSHFVEIGCWLGKSSCYMAEKIKEDGKLIRFDCIDIWNTGETGKAYEDMLNMNDGNVLGLFVNNLKSAGVINYMNLIQLSTFEAVNIYKDDSLDFIFIDNNHEAGHVYRELNLWHNKVKSGGIIAGHDYYAHQDWNVAKAVNTFVAERDLKLEVMTNSFWIERK